MLLLIPLSLSLLLALPVPARTSEITTLTFTATASAATASDITAASDYDSDNAFMEAALLTHNFYRTEHGIANLTWNETCADYAEKWSEGCVFEHSVGVPVSSFPYLLCIFFLCYHSAPESIDL